MDNRIANDMISSGMIPSGEKNKEDLSRTQYGSVPSPNKLMDAYKSMYEHHKKDADGNTIPHEGEELNEGKMPEGLKKYLEKKNAKKEDKKEMKEENIDEMNAGYATNIPSGSTKQGKVRTKAQMMAANRIASGRSIADVKAANTQSMRNRASARSDAFQAKRKPMPSNPQLKSQPQTSTSTSSNMSGSNRRAMMSKRRRGLMNDLDLFDLIKGAFIEEGYTESDALAFMVEASPEYLAELDRELTMLGAGLASIPAIAATAKKIFKPKVDKSIDKQRKTSPIGGDNRAKKIEKAAGAEGFFK